jgi:psp operon transcriptional activator
MDPVQVVGQSSPFLDALELASRAAPLDRPVLVVGERGTGKELLAERLHRLSPRWDGPLVTLNCAALPETLIEAELFGYEQGAFTGAIRARGGRFEEAEGGTLFLDELATLSSAAQERLLRAIEYGEVARIGARRPVQVNVRVVAATNEHLPALVDGGRFRADLLDRLAFEVITLPPLRARGEDIPLLAEHFGRRMAFELGWSGWPGFSSSVEHALLHHHWPGNVRQLKNVIERAVYRWDDPATPVGAVEFDPFASPWLVLAPPLPAATAKAPTATAASESSDFRAACAAFERRLLEDALERHRYNQRAAAVGLGLSYDQLRHALRRHGLLPSAGARAPV